MPLPMWPDVWPTNHPDYPRRRMQRRQWRSLNGPWEFAVGTPGTEHPGSVEDWGRSIQVPFAPESAASGIGDRSLGGDVWYRRTVQYVRASGDRLLLHFGAVDHEARVWIDGHFVGGHTGGFTPFALDITDELVDGDVHEIAVRARDDPQDLAIPRGKQDWLDEPHGIWYPRTTGIWQTVWLEEVPAQHLADVRLSADADRWEVGFDTRVDGAGSADGMRVRLRLSTADGGVLADDLYQVSDAPLHRRIALPDPGIDDAREALLWSPESPTLIRAEVWLLHDGAVIDEVRSYTAMRSVAVAGGQVLLNGRPYDLRLVLDQGYWPDTLMTPPSDDALIRDIELTRAAGFNGARKHQKVEDPRYLYWADVLGLLVWEEMPSAYRFTRESVQALTREWMEVIDRDLGQPCIVARVPFNESWGVPDLPRDPAQRSLVQALYHLTRSLDPSVPVVGNDGWEAVETDILTVHDYDDASRLRERYAADLTGALGAVMPGGRRIWLDDHPPRGQPVVLSEFGGIAYRPADAPTDAWGYSIVDSPAALQAAYERLLAAVHDIEGLAGFCYTQLTDTFQEANGLFTADREPKFALEAMRRATVNRSRRPDVPPGG